MKCKKGEDMKKLPLILLASLVVSGAASAEWLKVAENDSAGYYIGPAAIRKDGSLRKMWDVYNIKEPDKGGALSIRDRAEYFNF